MAPQKLICTKCGKIYPFALDATRCPDCEEPLEFPTYGKGSINKNAPYRANFVERYADFYPYMDRENIVSLGEGNTGLVNANALGQKIGFDPDTLFIKNETQNPTWSFKDRGTFIGANLAKQQGYKALGVVSSGNNAASCAAYAAALGMKAMIFVAGHILDEKILPIAVYGATVVRVLGDYGQLYYESMKLADKYGIYFANSDVHTRVEGAKSAAFELCEQFNFDVPEWVIVPTGSGGNLRGIEKGFREFYEAGLIDRIPKLVAAQPEGVCPIYKAYASNADHVTHFGEMFTVAHGVANPLPPSGNQTLRLIAQGRIHSAGMVLEKDILSNQRLLAESGIFVQPASSLCFGVAKQMLEDGVIQKGERVVCVTTGSGLKAATLLAKSNNYETYAQKIEDLDRFCAERM